MTKISKLVAQWKNGSSIDPATCPNPQTRNSNNHRLETALLLASTNNRTQQTAVLLKGY